MQLWRQGNANIKVRPEVGDGRLKVLLNGRLEKVFKSQVKDICDQWFYSCLDLWYRWRTFNSLPFALGWAEHPNHFIEIIETAESAYRSAG